MKLLELLVQKTLTGEFKWPKRASQIFQDYDSELRPDAEMSRVYLDPVAENHRICGVPFDTLGESYIVTREQYEAALAAAQQPVWNGEGLPPIGCDCEVMESKAASAFGDWTSCKVVHFNHKRGDESQVCIIDDNGDFAILYENDGYEFRPIRSEADKKRDEVIEALKYYVRAVDASDLYDAIVAGEVKGVKLDV